MSRKSSLGSLEPLDTIGKIYTARKGAARMMAFKLSDETVCLYSPVTGINDDFINNLNQVGRVSAIIAPSHYHHLGITEYTDQFPDADLFAAPPAIARLLKQTGQAFKDADILAPKLSGGLKFLYPEGLKVGELWLEYEADNTVGWAVCDAFAAAAKPDEPPQTKPVLRGAFKTMCVKDKEAYTTWARRAIAEASPEILTPCHGGLVRSKDLPEALLGLLEEL